MDMLKKRWIVTRRASVSLNRWEHWSQRRTALHKGSHFTSAPGSPQSPLLNKQLSKQHVFWFFLKLFVYFWLCWVFIAERRLSLVAAHGLLIAVASLFAEHGLQVRRLQ